MVLSRHSFTMESKAFRLLVAVLAALAVHLAFCLLYRPGPEPSADGSGRTAHHPPLAYLGHPDDSALSMTEKEMYEWAEIASPSRMLYPDYEAGFSRFGNPPLPHTLPGIAPYLPELAAIPAPDLTHTAVTLAPIPLPELIYRQWNRTTQTEQLALAVAPPASGVYWRFANGRQIVNAPEVSESQLQEAVQQSMGNGKFTDEAVTLVEILQEGLIPRLVLRQSCGLQAFDRLAIRALCETLREPTRIPSTGEGTPQNYLIQAIWRIDLPTLSPQGGDKP